MIGTLWPGKAGATDYTITPITNNNYHDWYPQIDAAQVVWQGDDGYDYEIFLHDVAAGTTTQITSNNYHDYTPQIDAGQVAWHIWDYHDYEIFLHDVAAGTTTQITNNDYDEYWPQIDAGQVVWYMYDGRDHEIFLHDVAAGTTTQITSNDYYDYYPQIAAGQVVWFGGTNWWSPGSEIFLHDVAAGTTTQITSNDYYDYEPQIDAGQVVWEGHDGHDYEIFLHDVAAGTTTQLTSNDYTDRYPQIDAGQVVWFGHDGHDYEIFLATPVEVACQPLSQGYWHRQCKATGEIQHGKSEKKPPLLQDNFAVLKGIVKPQLDLLLTQEQTTCQALDANPPQDPCEKALKQYAALLLNLADGRLTEDCKTGCCGTIKELKAQAEAAIIASPPDKKACNEIKSLIGEAIDELESEENDSNTDTLSVAPKPKGRR